MTVVVTETVAAEDAQPADTAEPEEESTTVAATTEGSEVAGTDPIAQMHGLATCLAANGATTDPSAVAPDTGVSADWDDGNNLLVYVEPDASAAEATYTTYYALFEWGFQEGPIVEVWLRAPTDEQLGVLDGCYAGEGLTPPSREASAAAAPNADGEFSSTCDYVLGDFTESASGFRFVADAELQNTGNIGIVVRVMATWKQAGGVPIKVVKTAKVPVNRSKHVGITRVASQDEIDLHQATDQGCKVKATIVDTFGEVK